MSKSEANNNAAIGEVSGAFLLGLVGSFQNLSTLPQGGMNLRLDEIDPTHWYPHSLLIDALHSIENTFLSENILFRAGSNFLRIWYENGPGKTLIHSGLDWLHANDTSGGYNSVVRGGSKDEIGWCLLQFIDEEAGIAVFENVMPLSPDYVKGVFYGGCILFDDMEYVEVEATTEPYAPNPSFNRIMLTVRFRLKPKTIGLTLDDKIGKLEFGSTLALSADEIESLIWRYKGLQYSNALNARYYNDINAVLADAIGVSQRITNELEVAKSSVEASNRELASLVKFNEAILLNSPLPMAVFSADGCCIEANDAFLQLVGAIRTEISILNFNSEDWKNSGMFDVSHMALASNSPQRREASIMTIYGEQLWVECRLQPLELHGKMHLLAQLVDLTERKRHEVALREMAFTDALTQLPNRRLLLDRLKQALNSSKRQRSYGAVLFLDLNKFKQLNDTHGHNVGDSLLIEVARRLQLMVRESDTVARLGGDEFVVLLVGLGEDLVKATDYANSVADKIYTALSEEYILDEIRHHGSVSIGIKLFIGDNVDSDQILQDADEAMYAAKQRLSY